MVRIKHWLSTIEIIDTEPRIQYSPNYRIDIVPKAKSQYRTSLLHICKAIWLDILYVDICTETI